ncbi:arabinanase [Pholiota conissans]|uniref:Arabinan endo-1,5-alpha-L-arabinosidase n=1 Tax=Pholiota conissans TaxID=109636 RepID=A0A9P5ZE35_9AGAR|nr:arabinanase [Pholiota conissans]
MRWLSSLLSAVTFSILTLAAVYPPPQAVTGNTAVHDPTICQDQHGTYFVFCTAPGIEIRTSKDRKNWALIGTVWPNGAPWTDQFTLTSNGSIWAPDCTYRNGEFLLYYAASSFGSQNSGIFLAKSKTGLPGSFTHEGLVTQSSPLLDYNAIDPNLIITGNSWRLSLGSFWTGIKSFDVDPHTGLFMQGNATSPTSLAERFVNSQSIEASVVFQHGNYFYLFSSWDFCCRGVNSTYNIRVGRSLTPSGGFVDQEGVGLINGGGTLVLETHDNIVGPGGQDLLVDKNGETLMVYHYYTPSGSFLGINKLDFSTGWPVVVPT